MQKGTKSKTLKISCLLQDMPLGHTGRSKGKLHLAQDFELFQGITTRGLQSVSPRAAASLN